MATSGVEPRGQAVPGEDLRDPGPHDRVQARRSAPTAAGRRAGRARWPRRGGSGRSPRRPRCRARRCGPRLRDARRPRGRARRSATTPQLVVDAAADEVRQLVGAGPGSAGHASHRARTARRPSSRPYLTTSAKPQASSRGGRVASSVGVHHHQLGLPDRADVVLALRQVDAGLAADGRVDHREQGRRHVDQAHAALVGGGDEAGQVAHDAAAERRRRRRSGAARPRPPGA